MIARFYLIFAVALIGVGAFMLPACEQKQEIVQLEPLPAIQWRDVPIVPFLTKEAWSGQVTDWNLISQALRSDLTIQNALETRLLREDREIWKNVLAGIASFELSKRDAVVLSNLTVPQDVQCEPPESVFSLQQRAQLTRTLQIHRNVLWRLGRLEMATRTVRSSLQQFLPQYIGGRIKDAELSVVQPLRQLASVVQDTQSLYPALNGVWNPGELHYRMARLSQLAPVFLQAKTSMERWNHDVLTSSRWQYLASTADLPIEAFTDWVNEYESVLLAYHYLAATVQQLEQSFLPPNNIAAFPCLNQNFKRLRIISGLLDALLPMQWSLVRSRNDAVRVSDRIASGDYQATSHEFMRSEVEQSISKIEAQQSRLSRATDLVLVLWDASNYKIWSAFPDFIDPIHNASKTAVEGSETWRALYQNLRTEVRVVSTKLKPEPEQPLDKRGKPYPSPVFKILEDLRSPTRIDEVEHGLLAISELEAHMVSVRDELLRLCKDGACRRFPEAELAKSPRTSHWVVSWRQSPVSERTLGHSLIVLKLCQLHLARLVQRLTEIYAWFAETSNADTQWKALKSWQRIWTLYAEPNGTYANFLRSVSTLGSQIRDMARPDKRRAQSSELLELLRIQTELFDLTIDYARFVDTKSNPPVPFDEMMETWEMLEDALERIAQLTEERDLKSQPELAGVKKRVSKDIDR